MTTAPTTPVGSTVDRMLQAITAGRGVPPGLFADGAVLDATVPGWRFTVRGREGVARQYSGWFADPAVLEDLERLAVPGGEVLVYLLSWVEQGVPHAAHHCHVLRIDGDGLIASDRFFCGGRWDAAHLASMAEADGAR